MSECIRKAAEFDMELKALPERRRRTYLRYLNGNTKKSIIIIESVILWSGSWMVGWSVGPSSVCHYFLKGQELHFQAPMRALASVEQQFKELSAIQITDGRYKD